MAKRRANGEGNIRKRADGRWEGRYTAGHNPTTGKTIYKNVLGKTQAEVKEKLKKAIEETKGLDIAKAESYTLGQWMDVWFEYYAKIKVRVSSHKTYEGYIKNHIKPNIGNIPLTKLTTLDLQMMYQKLLTGGRVDRLESQNQPKGLSAKTVRNLNQIISSAMKLAMQQKLVAHNPADGCALPRVEHREMKTLPAEQLAAFLNEAEKTGTYEMYYLDLATGMRRGELLGLKWEDIDFDHGVIHIRRQVARLNGAVQEAPLKTKNSYRNISIGTDAVELLKQKKEQDNGKSVYVFPSPTGGPLAPDSVLHMLHRVLERAGLAEDTVPRFAAYLCDVGTPEWCGHQDRVRYAGTFLGRVHVGYLCPCDNGGAKGGGGNYGGCIGHIGNIADIPRGNFIGQEGFRQIFSVIINTLSPLSLFAMSCLSIKLSIDCCLRFAFWMDFINFCTK